MLLLGAIAGLLTNARKYRAFEETWVRYAIWFLNVLDPPGALGAATEQPMDPASPAPVSLESPRHVRSPALVDSSGLRRKQSAQTSCLFVLFTQRVLQQPEGF